MSELRTDQASWKGENAVGMAFQLVPTVPTGIKKYLS
jgi:hypothetical protein